MPNLPNCEPFKIDNQNSIIIQLLNGGTSFTFESWPIQRGFITGGSSAATFDASSVLFGKIMEWKSLPVSSLNVNILEVKDLERIIERLNALESVSGILNDLTDEEMEVFDETVKRRPLFE